MNKMLKLKALFPSVSKIPGFRYVGTAIKGMKKNYGEAGGSMVLRTNRKSPSLLPVMSTLIEDSAYFPLNSLPGVSKTAGRALCIGNHTNIIFPFLPECPEKGCIPDAGYYLCKTIIAAGLSAAANLFPGHYSGRASWAGGLTAFPLSGFLIFVF